MGIIDWFIVIFLLYFVINGFRRGLSYTLIQIAALILSFFLVGHYYPLLANRLMQKFAMYKAWASIISIVMILVLVVAIKRLVNWLTKRFLDLFNLTTANRFLGAAFGILNGLACVIVFSVVLDYMPKISKPLEDSKKHKVYAGVQVIKEEIFARLKMENRLRYIKMPSKLNLSEKTEDMKAEDIDRPGIQ